jgi:hypothetical protein
MDLRDLAYLEVIADMGAIWAGPPISLVALSRL